MLKTINYLIIVTSLLLVSCGKDEEPQPQTGSHKVTVKSTQNASNYSYLLVEENDQEYWIAVPQMEIKPGEQLIFTKSLEMLNFQSPTLNKTFDKILFVEDAVKPSSVQNIPSPHSQVKSAGKQNIKVTPLDNGITIEKIYADKGKLEGKTILIKGVVTRFNENIMDRNWIHIQDGTGSAEDYDLVITTPDSVAVGKEIVLEGKVVLNQDFGYGYSYSVMLENGKIKAR